MNEKYKDNEIVIRQARKEDMQAVADMIQELADFEKMPDGPKLSVKDLQHDCFEKNPPAFRCKVAVLQGDDGTAPVVGYAIYFPTYSTWEGPAMMLEDLCVRTEHRRRGIGRKLFLNISQEAWSSGCRRLDFHVLEWNPARALYEAAGAADLTAAERWCYYRLSGDRLRQAAAAAK